MLERVWRFVVRRPIIFAIILSLLHCEYIAAILRKNHQKNSSLLLDFTCATVKDEVDKNSDMRMVAIVELENNFSREFCREVLKCLPKEVAVIIINPHEDLHGNSTLMLPKQTMVIFIADILERVSN